MPRETCIEHPTSHYFLTLREPVLRMFRGDHCATALFAVFEYATNGEFTRMARAGDSGQPWVTASLSTLHREILELYSVRSLQERLAWLIALGFIKEHPENAAVSGKAGQYLLNVDFANDAIVRHREFDLGNFAEVVKNAHLGKTAEVPLSKLPRYLGKTAEVPLSKLPRYLGKTAEVEPPLRVKVLEEELRREEYNSLPSFSENLKTENPACPGAEAAEGLCSSGENLESTRSTETFSPWDVPTTYRILRGCLIRGGVKVPAATGKEIQAALQRLDQDAVAEQVIWDARDEFLAQDKSGMYNPAAVFVKVLYQFAGGERRRAPRRVAAAAPVRFSPPAPSPSTPQIAGGAKNALPARVEQWNSLVPEALRVDLWTSLSPVSDLADAEANPEFDAKFVDICARVSKCHSVGRIHPSFDWLFEKSKAKVNWYRVAKGLFAWAERQDEPPGAGRSAETQTSLMAARLRAKIAAREAAKLKEVKEIKEDKDGKDGREHRESVPGAHGKLGMPERAPALGDRLAGSGQSAA